MAKKTITMIAEDLTKIYQSSKQLYVTLLDNNTPLSNKEVYFTINSVTYTRTTNNQGIAQLNINLPIGTYPCTVTSFSDENYNSTTKNITVTVTDKKNIVLLAVDFTKTYGTPDPLKVTLYHQTSPLTNRDVYITINGIKYTRKTDNKGEARLNINLIPGEYTAKVVTFSDEEYSETKTTIKVTVKANTKVDGTNVTKKFSQNLPYQCAVYDDFNRINCEVSITVNGKTYIRKTDSEGLAKLNIRLPAGEYTIKAEYKGDATHNPSSTTNTIVVLPDITPITKKADGNYTIPGNNRGFMQSHIYITRIDFEKSKENKYYFDTPNWGEIIGAGNADDIRFDNYEIIETDPRVRTAKFTTDTYIDLTKGRSWVYIANPFHENFGGRILDIDYDKTNGLYIYQCQDGRRQYVSKHRTITSSGVIYDILEHLIIKPLVKDALKFPITDEHRKKYARALSGLHPIGDYKVKQSLVLGEMNQMEARVTTLAYDSLIDKIMNYSHYGQNPVDVYFSPDGIIHIDPVNIDTWLNQGIKLTHSDLIQYKYGFDTTNIITSVSVKDPNNSKNYDDWGDLMFYFGMNQSMIDPKTTSSNNASSSSSSSSSGNGVVINKSTGLRDNSGANIAKNRAIYLDTDNLNGMSESKCLNDCATALRNAGYSDVRVGGIGPNYHATDVTSGRVPDNGVLFCIFGGYCAGTFWDMCQPYIQNHVKNRGIQIVFGFTDMPNQHANKPSSTNPQGTHLDKVTWLARAYDDNFSGLSGLSNPGQYLIDHGIHYVYGDSGTELGQNLAAGNSGASATSSNSSTNTVVDDAGTYQKALEEMSKSIRDLLSFQIRVPLNDPLFKELHTNQMLWTELPSDFKLANLEKIFKILPAYKVNRGIPYQQNRWYVEGLKITCNNNGLFADITLNPFPSNYSVYHNAVKAYAEAYDQAFKSSSDTTSSNNTTVSTVNNIPARTDGKNDCSDTYSLCCAHTGSSSNPSNHGYEDRANAQGKIGREGTNYADFVKGCTPKEAYKKLASRHNASNYSGYPDNNQACASNTLYASWTNCGDRARLLKACMDVLGQPCVIYHVYNHYMNGVLINGRWETVDLCYQSGSMPQYQTAGWNR